jgi:hypothetical protein
MFRAEALGKWLGSRRDNRCVGGRVGAGQGIVGTASRGGLEHEFR